jgi:outer membrane immunogenic protein
MRKLLLTTVAFNVLALPAMAADLVPVKAPPPAAPSWTGFYIGGNVGGVFNNNSVDTATTVTSLEGVFNNFGLSFAPAIAAAATGNVPVDSSTLIGGFQAGYNWQLAPTWVVGLEADIQGIATVGAGNGITNRAVHDNFNNFSEVATILATNKVDWLGTVRGRLGYLVTPKWLIYGTGGLAYGHVSSTTSINDVTVPSLGVIPFGFPQGATSGAFSGTRVGWTAGVGAEYMFAPNWTVKAEYLHYDLGSVTYSNGSLIGVAPLTLEFSDSSSSTTRFSGEIVRGGINYKF